MLATFVIGLREGLEASIIVGIVAAFLKANGRPGDLRRMWLGVLAAVLLCTGIGVALELITNGLPQREQEMLETVIAAIAVVMVSYMVLWMKQHSRGLKAGLEATAANALVGGSALALVGMAFLAVLREGIETAVFLVAAFQQSANTTVPVIGAALGIAVAIGLGWMLYRGGVRFNMSRFFRATGVVLVLVAAGLVAKTFRAAYEAGWLGFGQQPTIDLSAVITPGSITEALATGVLGIPAKPVAIQLIGYLLYLVPMLAVVLWPPTRTPSRARLRRLQFGCAAALLLLAAASFALAPRPVEPATLSVAGAPSVAGDADTTRSATSVPADLSATMTGSQLAAVNNGRYPVGLSSLDRDRSFPVAWSATEVTTVTREQGSIVAWTTAVQAEGRLTTPAGSQVSVSRTSPVGASTPAASAEARAAVAANADTASRHDLFAITLPTLALAAAAVFALFALAGLRAAAASSHPKGADSGPGTTPSKENPAHAHS